METTAISYKLIKKIKDERFSVDDIEHYSLVLQIGIRDFQVCIIDTRNNQCLLLEDYVLAAVNNNAALVASLQKIFEEHHLLKAGFWRNVRIAVKNNKFSLVPDALFVPDAVQDYLKINAEIDLSNDKILYYKGIKGSVNTVFSVDQNIYDFLNSVYPTLDIEFVHQSSALIEGVLENRGNAKAGSVFLYIDRFKLHIITLNKEGLEYYNQFPIKQFSDYIKYIMLVMKGLGYSQTKSDVIMWGYIGKQSPHYNEFYKYIKTISFGDRPGYLKYSFMFDELQDHHFYDLYSVYLCD